MAKILRASKMVELNKMVPCVDIGRLYYSLEFSSLPAILVLIKYLQINMFVTLNFLILFAYNYTT